MSKKSLNLVLMVAGLLLLVLSLVADFIGIGTYPGINYTQIAGAAAGLILFVIGYWFSRKTTAAK